MVFNESSTIVQCSIMVIVCGEGNLQFIVLVYVSFLFFKDKTLVSLFL